MLGEVTHALERGGDAQGADDDAQVRRHRRLEGDDVEALLLDLGGHHIDGGIRGDDLLGHPQVGIQERLSCPIHGRSHEACEMHQIVTDVVQLRRECFAHGAPPSLHAGHRA